MRLEGASLSRLATRAFRGSFLHEPPRFTRLEDRSAPAPALGQPPEVAAPCLEGIESPEMCVLTFEGPPQGLLGKLTPLEALFQGLVSATEAPPTAGGHPDEPRIHSKAQERDAVPHRLQPAMVLVEPEIEAITQESDDPGQQGPQLGALAEDDEIVHVAEIAAETEAIGEPVVELTEIEVRQVLGDQRADG